jgi:hypothetical protein
MTWNGMNCSAVYERLDHETKEETGMWICLASEAKGTP